MQRLLCDISASDRQCVPCDERGGIRTEPEHGGRNLVRLPKATHGQRRTARCLTVRPPLIVAHGGPDIARANGVDAHAPLGILEGSRLGQPDDAVFAGRVGGVAA